MKEEYQATLYTADGREIAKLHPKKLKKDVLEDLDTLDLPFHHAEVKLIYTKGGEVDAG